MRNAMLVKPSRFYIQDLHDFACAFFDNTGNTRCQTPVVNISYINVPAASPELGFMNILNSSQGLTTAFSTCPQSSAR